MTLKQYYTTGEAAELLQISRSTISRKFDRGAFFGKKNPITGERMISRESIAAFMNQYNLSTDILAMEKKKVLLGSSDERLLALAQKVFSADERVEVESVRFGGDVLVSCSKERPELLVIDEDLSDIPVVEVIRSLRRREELGGLRIVCLAKNRNARRCLEWGADEAFAREELEREELKGRLYGMLGLSEVREEGPSVFEHQRRWPRMGVRVPAKIGVYRLRAPHRREPGEAMLENISCGGAYLSGIRVDSGVIPCEPFRVLLEVAQEPLQNLRTHCKVVRLQTNGSMGAGVQFTRLSKSNLRMIETMAQ